MVVAKDIHEDHDTSTENADESNHDPQFEPTVSLPEQEIKMLEGRRGAFQNNDLPGWKEQGTGYVKLLKQRGTRPEIIRQPLYPASDGAEAKHRQ
ncbi:hypothetical protein QTO34_005317 [Cnephaeus nilssonii]|uniref:Uncharacterized protein n=1 Tax=Cnephaeus nilssonii TaxID=3371016 RepID=A0AA40HN44_CNENI|nr:hypothetical protein QTO34_005317 [Eptesicus nilssonii]